MTPALPGARWPARGANARACHWQATREDTPRPAQRSDSHTRSPECPWIWWQQARAKDTEDSCSHYPNINANQTKSNHPFLPVLPVADSHLCQDCGGAKVLGHDCLQTLLVRTKTQISSFLSLTLCRAVFPSTSASFAFTPLLSTRKRTMSIVSGGTPPSELTKCINTFSPARFLKTPSSIKLGWKLSTRTVSSPSLQVLLRNSDESSAVAAVTRWRRRERVS